MTNITINLVIQNASCLVVGGGKVALRKVLNLLQTGATITVIAPVVEPQLNSLAQQKKIVYQARKYHPGDVEHYRLVIAATNEQRVNEAIYHEATAAGILCNVVDDPPHCSFFFPATIRKGDFQISISSTGQIPYAVKRFRELFESLISFDGWEDWWSQATELRLKVNKSALSEQEKNSIFNYFFAQTIRSSGTVTVQSIAQSDWLEILHRIEYGPRPGVEEGISTEEETPNAPSA